MLALCVELVVVVLGDELRLCTPVVSTPSQVVPVFSCLLIRIRPFCVYHVFTDPGDDAPSRQEISLVLVRLLLQRDVKTI